MDVQKVAPCFDCGHSDEALVDLELGLQEYHAYLAFDLEVILCDPCADRFDSYRPEFFGASEQDYEVIRGRRLMAPKPLLDGVCPHCQHRRAFLDFVRAARALHGA